MAARLSYTVSVSLFGALFGAWSSAPAQNAGEARAGLEEIVVTAQKRQESLQDVPMAVTAVTGETLEKMGADSLEQYARDVPSLQFSSLGPGGRQRLSIRGVNPNSGAASVGFYIDDTPIPTNVGFVNLINIDPKLTDVERIEVLRGPQGTLYGSGSMAGLIKIVTHAPDAQNYQGNLGVTASQTMHGGVNSSFDGVANAPIIEDKLAIRILGYHRNNDGFIKRIYGETTGEFVPNENIGVQQDSANERVDGARAVLGFYPLQTLRLSLSAYAERTTMDGYPAIDGGARNPGHDLIFQQPLNVSEPFTTNWQLYSFTLNWDAADAINVTSNTSHFERQFSLVEDGTEQLSSALGGPNVAAPIEEITEVKSFTQEVRISSSHPLHGTDFLLGLFYQRTTGARGSNWIVPGANAVYEPLGLPVPNDNLYTASNDTTNSEKAVFGQVSYDFLSTLQLTAGFRRFDLSGSIDNLTDGVFANGVPTRTAANSSSNKTNYSAALEWHPTKERMFYVRAAQGLRPGAGLSPLPSPCRDDLIAAGFDPDHPPTQVNPDSVWNYELGAKTNWAGGKLAMNGTLFWINWKDIQQSLLLSCGFTIEQNAGKAISRGAELEVVVAPVPSLELSAAGTFTDARLDADAPQLNGKKGDRIEEVPRVQFGGSATYQFPVLAPFTGYLRGDVQYVGNSWLSFSQDDPLTKRPGYAMVNLRAGLQSDKWEYSLFLDNVLDRRADLAHPDSLTFNILDRPRIVVSRPRTVGITIRRTF